MIRYLARFDADRVEGDMSSWFGNEPLGRLLNAHLQKTSGRYLYYWYGQQNGDSARVTPPSGTGVLQAVASIASSKTSAAVIIGGSSGSNNVTFSGFSSTKFGSSVKVTISTLVDSGDSQSSGPAVTSTSTGLVSNATPDSARARERRRSPLWRSPDRRSRIRPVRTASSQTISPYSATVVTLTQGTASTGPSASASASASATATSTATATATANPTGPAKSCAVTWSLTNSWPGGYQVGFTVTDNGTAATTSWTVGYSWPGSQAITQIWNASETQTGAAVSVTNLSYNGALSPAGSTTFGLLGSGATPASLTGLTCTAH